MKVSAAKNAVSIRLMAIAFLAGVLGFGSIAHAWVPPREAVGWNKLQAELGALMPTGTGIAVAQIEAPEGTAYMPDPGNTELLGKTFVTGSYATTGFSSHATSVGRYFYGTAYSLAPGVTNIKVYEANAWLTNQIKYSTTSEPQAMTDSQGAILRVQNYSWIGNLYSSNADALRRFDYMINRDRIFAVVGTDNNNSTIVPNLLTSSYNAISVGRSDGLHAHGLTATDGAGRIKPDIVAPGGTTSTMTALVSGAGAMLLEHADRTAALVNARTNPQVIKAILMASATKSIFPDWERSIMNAQGVKVYCPLDDTYGAGQLNVYDAYHLLNAGQFQASSTSLVNDKGWDYGQSASTPKLYFFDIADYSSGELSVILAWNRIVTDGMNGPNWGNPTSSLANLNLKLYSAAGFATGSLIDQSMSTVDNVECLYQVNLPAGRYAIEVSSLSGQADYGLAWQSNISYTADFNRDGRVDALDIDMLYNNFGSNLVYDLTGEGLVNQEDVTRLVTVILGTTYGDANLDKVVDFSDFQALLDNWMGPSTWSRGDFNGDKITDFSDFQYLLDNWNPAGSAPPPPPSGQIPEPTTLLLLCSGLLITLRARRNRL